MNGQLQLTDAPYSERALAWIVALHPGDVFTADGMRSSVGEPPEANALGAIIVQASRRHLIRYDGREERSARIVARGRWQRRWQRTEREAT